MKIKIKLVAMARNELVTLYREVDWPVPPAIGDSVELGDGWASEIVSNRTFTHDGSIYIDLRRSTYEPSEVAALLEEGWQKY